MSSLALLLRMPHILPAADISPEDHFAIVVARWNQSITTKLLDGAVATLLEAGVADASIVVAWVPGSWEIPVVAARMAESGNFRAVISLGAVIRG